MAQKSTHSSDLSLTRDYQGVLKSLWKSDAQRPEIYSRELFRRFWDAHIPEVRKK